MMKSSTSFLLFYRQIDSLTLYLSSSPKELVCLRCYCERCQRLKMRTAVIGNDVNEEEDEWSVLMNTTECCINMDNCRIQSIVDAYVSKWLMICLSGSSVYKEKEKFSLTRHLAVNRENIKEIESITNVNQIILYIIFRYEIIQKMIVGDKRKKRNKRYDHPSMD